MGASNRGAGNGTPFRHFFLAALALHISEYEGYLQSVSMLKSFFCLCF